MPSYFINSGVKMTMDDNLFDMMWNSIGNSDATDTETIVESPKNKYDWRKQENGYYNSKPNDKDYFKKYYQEKQNNRVYVTFVVLTLVVNQIYQSIKKQRSANSF